jgi:hypothetical protein
VLAFQYTFTHNSRTIHIHTQTAVQYTFTHKQQSNTHSNTNSSPIHIHTQTSHSTPYYICCQVCRGADEVKAVTAEILQFLTEEVAHRMYRRLGLTAVGIVIGCCIGWTGGCTGTLGGHWYCRAAVRGGVRVTRGGCGQCRVTVIIGGSEQCRVTVTNMSHSRHHYQ